MKRKRKIEGDEYLEMKEMKKSRIRRKAEKAGLRTVVSISSALSAIVLGYAVTKFRSKNINL